MEKTFSHGQVVSVLTSQPINRLLDYYVYGFEVKLGQYIIVPFGKKEIIGIVWGKGISGLSNDKLKKISKILPLPLMENKFRKFLMEVSTYNICSLNQVLKLTFLDITSLSNFKKESFYSIDNYKNNETRLIKKLKNLYELNQKKSLSIKEIKEKIKISKSTIEKYAKIGVLKKNEAIISKNFEKIHIGFNKNLTEEQKNISVKLREKINSNKFQTTLLYGVTGSGKTEVYFDAISETLSLGKQVLVLLPEISLTLSFLDRFEKRFKIRPSEWHSNVKKTERREIFYGVSNNDLKLIIGARSSLFLPFSNLGLIVVDEEHDVSYKQEDGVCYNARDMAVLRAYYENANVILASATPSLESWLNCKIGKYEILKLKNRFQNYSLPKISPIDMNVEMKGKNKWISKTLEEKIKLRIKKKEKTLLFLNRRGYSPITLCKECGFVISCKNCDKKLVYHLKSNFLVCHQCGFKQRPLKKCIFCNKDDTLKSIGPGVERIAEECSLIFKNSKIKILSSDSMTNKEKLKVFFDDMKKGEIDIVIGTQIVSKGHNFPAITLVGVIDGDIGFEGIDLRSTEKSFQMIRQVVGRAGRDGKESEGLIQTWKPNHPLLNSLLNYDDEQFLETEIQIRKRAFAPPFSRFIALILTGKNEKKMIELGLELSKGLKNTLRSDFQIFGPSLAPISKIKNKIRVRMLIKTGKEKTILIQLSKWKENLKLPSFVRLTIDVDPYNFN